MIDTRKSTLSFDGRKESKSTTFSFDGRKESTVSGDAPPLMRLQDSTGSGGYGRSSLRTPSMGGRMSAYRERRRSSVAKRSSWFDPGWWEETRGRLLSPSVVGKELEEESVEVPSVLPMNEWYNPPRDAKPVARWWWPGGSVQPAVIDEQLVKIARAGFGAVEIQPFLLALGSAELAADPQLRTVGTPPFFKLMAHAAKKCAELGLALDVTLGSGWPGGLPTKKANSEQQLLMASLELRGPTPATAVQLPPPPEDSIHRAYAQMMLAQLDTVGPTDEDVTLVAVVACRVAADGFAGGGSSLSSQLDITRHARNGKLSWAVPEGHWKVFAFYANTSSHFAMGGGFPGVNTDAPVVDHLSSKGCDALVSGYGVPMLREISRHAPVRAVFVDSFEFVGELPFTPSFLEVFRAHIGYDLTPYLPYIFKRGGESKYIDMADFLDVFGLNGSALHTAADDPLLGVRVREDYDEVRRFLFGTRFVGGIAKWCRQRGADFRLQAHGGYGDYLDTYAQADIPEAETLFGHGSFDFLKLASSAAHVAGRALASSESFINVRAPHIGTQLTLEEMRLLAGRQYSAGINRLVFHGLPYPYTRADGTEWYPFPSGLGAGAKLSTIKPLKTAGANVRMYTMEEGAPRMSSSSGGTRPSSPAAGRSHASLSTFNEQLASTVGSRGVAAGDPPATDGGGGGSGGAPWPTDRRASNRRMKAGPLPMSTHFDGAYLERLPTFTATLGRLTVAMTAGLPSAEVAWLRAEPIYPDEPFVVTGRLVPYYAESNVTKAFRRRGLTYDRVSRKMLADAKVVDGRLAIGARTYTALLLDPLPVAEPALVSRLVRIAEADVPVIALGDLPDRAPGLHDAAARDDAVRAAVDRLAPLVEPLELPSPPTWCRCLPCVGAAARDEAEVHAIEVLLAECVAGQLVEPFLYAPLHVSIERRVTPSGHVLLVFNESYQAATARFRFTAAGRQLMSLDPETGICTLLRPVVRPNTHVTLQLRPTQTLVLTLAFPEGHGLRADGSLP